MEAELRELKPWHVGQILRHLRETQAKALLTVGIKAHRELTQVVGESSIKYSWFVGGELYGIGGVLGTFASTTGFVWLALSPDIARRQLSLVRVLRDRLYYTSQLYAELVATVLIDDKVSQRFAFFMGFQPADLGYTLPNGFIGLRYKGKKG